MVGQLQRNLSAQSQQQGLEGLLLRNGRGDPEMRPKPISPEQREVVIAHMAVDFWVRISISEHKGKPTRAPTRLMPAQCLEDRTKRALSVRIRKEIQEVLRRGDGHLSSGRRTPRLQIALTCVKSSLAPDAHLCSPALRNSRFGSL